MSDFEDFSLFRKHVQTMRWRTAITQAWQDVFTERTLSALESLSGAWLHQNNHNLSVAYHCHSANEAALKNLLTRLIKTPLQSQFRRRSFITSTASIEIPLSALLRYELPPETTIEHSEPQLRCGLTEYPWVVSYNCFQLKHRIRFDERRAQMFFVHPNLREPELLEEEDFPKDTKRDALHEALMEKIKERAPKSHVTIAWTLRERAALLRDEDRAEPFTLKPAPRDSHAM